MWVTAVWLLVLLIGLDFCQEVMAHGAKYAELQTTIPNYSEVALLCECDLPGYKKRRNGRLSQPVSPLQYNHTVSGQKL